LADLLSPKSQKGIRVVSAFGRGSTFSFILEDKEKTEPKDQSDHLEKLNYSLEVAEELPTLVQAKFVSKIQKINTSSSISPLAAKTFESESFIKGFCPCPKILIVDDNPFNTMAFETILGSLGTKCDSVYSGSVAVQQLQKDCRRYLVIFMDQEMPEMTGAETVKEIKGLRNEKLIQGGIKFIGCTVHKAKEEVDRFLASGLDECIHKLISTAMIKDILKGSLLFE